MILIADAQVPLLPDVIGCAEEKPVKPASHCAVDDSEGSRPVWLGVEWWADVSNVLSQAGMDITYVLRVLKAIIQYYSMMADLDAIGWIALHGYRTVPTWYHDAIFSSKFPGF
ncbi:hypothetical protein I7I48_12140 [Histoplasma ohiense]|nr:hypothetical protein I7I48_12140 [Histoplasma ohiense (nom. inval.)]